jgi:hypothetical protein
MGGIEPGSKQIGLSGGIAKTNQHKQDAVRGRLLVPSDRLNLCYDCGNYSINNIDSMKKD